MDNSEKMLQASWNTQEEFIKTIERLRASNASLLAACKGLMQQFYAMADADTQECIQMKAGPHYYHEAEAAIAKAEERQQ